MGLDMYLNKKTYVKNWDHMAPEKKHEISVKKNGVPVSHIRQEKISYIEEKVGYWRKANQVHKWFVDHCQDGNDDCREAYVSIENLEELLKICKEIKEKCPLVEGDVQNGYTFKDGKEVPIIEKGMVMTNIEVAQELLPSQSGFFFGGTNYDQYYMQDIDDTIEILEAVLKDKDEKGNLPGSYYYNSSW